jgi:hypothetical protein
MGLSFGRSLGCDEAVTSLVFGFRWTRLAGRTLGGGANRRWLLPTTGAANQDQITTAVTVPLETPLAGIGPHVENVVRELLALFGGTEFSSPVISAIVTERLRGRR